MTPKHPLIYYLCFMRSKEAWLNALAIQPSLPVFYLRPPLPSFSSLLPSLLSAAPARRSCVRILSEHFQTIPTRMPHACRRIRSPKPANRVMWRTDPSRLGQILSFHHAYGTSSSSIIACSLSLFLLLITVLLSSSTLSRLGSSQSKTEKQQGIYTAPGPD